MSVPFSYNTPLQFAHALAIVRAIPQNSTLQPVAADKLQFYGLYKQATDGDINIPRPSSRQVVEYAKWKAWSRMKSISPMDAQALYVESLIHLLTELVHRYPHHEQASFLKKALHSLEHPDEDVFHDACDSTEFDLQEHFLTHIEADQLRRQDIYSPPSTPASFQTKSGYHHRYNSISDFSHTEFPITPMTSPGQNALTGQWVLNQLHEHNTKAYAHPMDFLQPDGISEADTVDREVAAATSNLSLTSPAQSPYSPIVLPKKKHSHSSSTSSKKTSHRALEKLQTEVMALTEQLDRLQRQQSVRKDSKRWKLAKMLIKHLIADSAIFLIAFYILWKKKSPFAYAFINSIQPIFQQAMRNMIRKVVFWKITV